MHRLAIIIFVAIIATCSIALPQSPPAGLEGIWEGAGIQDNKSTWTIRVVIAKGSYSIDYPSLNCGGNLRLLETTGNKMVFREELSYGLKRCINGGKTVIIKAGENEAIYQWYYPDGRKGAVGTLSRSEN